MSDADADGTISSAIDAPVLDVAETGVEDAAADGAAEAVRVATGDRSATEEVKETKAENGSATQESTPADTATGEGGEDGEGSGGDMETGFPADFVYTDAAEEMSKPLVQGELSPQYWQLHKSLGFECTRRSIIEYIDKGILLFVMGNSVQLLNLYTGEKNILTAKGASANNGIGAICVHPSKQFFAVGEKGIRPNIYIYKYPELQVVRILRAGADRSYASLNFSHTGARLASVGGSPDYLLTIWDWDLERVVLRTKAFSQEITKVAFSPINEGRLQTCGQGHVRFWKMASTFTGLKLQGAIGKFGSIDLCDISAFCELPDGKVLTGSEAGFLFMWDGNFIQFVVARQDGSPCHAGLIEHISMEVHPDGKRQILTAGQDGYIRKWRFDKLEFAEPQGEDLKVFVEPSFEVSTGHSVDIKNLIRGSDGQQGEHWLIQDAKGGLLKLAVDSNKPERLLDVHAGTITGLDVSSSSHTSVTCGEDGSVRSWDLRKGAQLYCRRFDCAALSLCWAPESVDDELRTVLVGFSNGVVRVLKRYAEDFRLVTSFKPHNVPVVHMAISKDGRQIATVANDGCVFFFTVGVKALRFTPVGFVKMDLPVVSPHWTNDSQALVFGNGQDVVICPRPDPGAYGADASRNTYQIKLPLKRFKCAVRQWMPKPEEEKPQGDDEADDDFTARQRAEAREKDEYADSMEKKKADGTYHIQEDRRYELMLDERPDPIAAVQSHPDSAGVVFLTYAGAQNPKDPLVKPEQNKYEQLYVCNLEQEDPLKVLWLGQDCGTVSRLSISKSRKHLVVAFKTGGLQVRPLNDLGFFMRIQLHGGEQGAVLGAALTFDDQLITSVGQDGGLFVSRIDMDTALMNVDRSHSIVEQSSPADAEAEKAKHDAYLANKARREEEVAAAQASGDLKALEDLEQRLAVAEPKSVEEALENKLDAKDGDDIRDASAYSIEDAKQKQEEDERKIAAEKKKQLKRAEIQELREEFAFLLKKNSQLEESQRLPRSAFELDPRLRQQLEHEAASKIEDVKKELAWISEKHFIALKKLKAKFLDDLEIEFIKLSSFRSPINVCCYRSPFLPQFLIDAIQQMHEIIEASGDDGKETLASPQKIELKLTDDTEAFLGNGKSGNAEGGKGKKDHRKAGMREAEKRKKDREDRKNQLEVLKKMQQNQAVDDPADKAAVDFAEKNMGDYKLKSDPDYTVPENQRVNTERKRRRMVLLQESVHFLKMGFNERFLALRDLKGRLIAQVKEDNKRIGDLNKALGITHTLFAPELDPSEWPETRDKFSPADIAAFEQWQKEEEKRLAEAKRGANKFGGGEEDEAPGEAKQGEGDKDGENGAVAVSTADSAEAKKVLEAVRLAEKKALHMERMAQVPKSDMEKAEDAVKRRLLEAERQTLLENIEFAVWSFDQAVLKLRQQKFKLDADLKSTDMKLLVLYDELNLLKDFEETENLLFAKLSKFTGLKAQIVAEMTECEKQLASKLGDIALWQHKDKEVIAEFNQVVNGDGKSDSKTEYYPQLLRIFKRKVRRSKKKVNQDIGEDEDSDEGENEEEEENDSDDDSDESDEDDSCPVNCDNAVYEKVLELRDKRLEQEEILVEFEKQVALLRKTYSRHQSKETNVNTELDNVKMEIEAFHSEKQRSLNQIDVTVPLTLSQIKYLKDGRLPKDLTNALIFTSSSLTKLRGRINELQNEKIQHQKQFKELKKLHRQLLKDIHQKKALIDAEKKHCEDVQMLKFGQIIDLSILSKVGDDEGASQLRAKLKMLEDSSVKKLTEWDRKIAAAKDELAKVTQQNTVWLEKVARLTQAQYQLEHQLNKTTTSVNVSDSSPMDDKAEAERSQLLQLVQVQEKEIDALKAEVHVLRRKGGHVYTPQ